MKDLQRLVAVATLALAACNDSTSDEQGGGGSDGSGGGGGGGGSTCNPTQTTARQNVGEVELEVTIAGCGPTMVMLHGFPEFSFTWDPIAAELAKDFRVVRPNLRGYPPSEAPATVESYEASKLIDDIVGLIESVSDEKVIVVSHDWGGVLGWAVAMQRPDLLSGFIVMNAPPPGVWGREVQTEPQKSASGYINFFLMEDSATSLAANDYGLLTGAFGGLLTAEQETQYKEAWGQPGMLDGGLNYYRANLQPGPVPLDTLPEDVPVEVPVLVLWGDADEALLGEVLLDDLDPLVEDLTVVHYPEAGHFLMYEVADDLVAEIRTFSTAL